MDAAAESGWNGFSLSVEILQADAGRDGRTCIYIYIYIYNNKCPTSGERLNR